MAWPLDCYRRGHTSVCVLCQVSAPVHVYMHVYRRGRMGEADIGRRALGMPLEHVDVLYCLAVIHIEVIHRQ